MRRRQRPITGQIETGLRVLTVDGQEIGVVSELTSKDFKVDAPHRRDFWLSRQDIAEADDDAVTLHFDLAELDRLAVPVDAFHSAEAGPPPPLEDVLSEEQTGDQRERMLREMAEGRQRLQHEHPEGPAAPPDTGGTFGEPVEEELARREGVPIEQVVRSAPDVDTQEPGGGGGTGARVDDRDDTHVPPEPPESARASAPLSPSTGRLPEMAEEYEPDLALEEREWLPVAPAMFVLVLALVGLSLALLVRTRTRPRRRLHALRRR